MWRGDGEDVYAPENLKPRYTKLAQCMIWAIISGDGKYFFIKIIFCDKIIKKILK